MMNNNILDNKKVVLGLSGGVDSTTAALLLKKEGFQVTGLFFDALGTNLEGRQKAEKVAQQLGIDFIYEDVSKDFNDIVIGNFCHEYITGRTPNPCIVCNPAIKFKVLCETADRIGAFHIATGHYGKTVRDEETGNWYLCRGKNEKKDQTYMLYRLPQSVIERLIMPLENYDNKEEVREIARQHAMDNAEDKDSQEICFIPEGKNYKDYLAEKGYSSSSGDFIDASGKVLGQHSGIINYTIGQRKGLGITFGKPQFVVRRNYRDNTIVLGDNEELFDNTVEASDCFFTLTGDGRMPEEYQNIEVEAKIRYAAKPAKAVISQEDGVVKAVFSQKQRAAAPGQSMVFYLGDRVIGGGFIR